MMPYAEGDEVEALVGLDWLPVTVVEAYPGADGQGRLVVRMAGGDTFGSLAANVRPRGLPGAEAPRRRQQRRPPTRPAPPE